MMDGNPPSTSQTLKILNRLRGMFRAGLIASNTDSTILDALLEYEQRGYYKIENDIVNLTDNGLAECRKPVHDWV
jgi:hypothetical protein